MLLFCYLSNIPSSASHYTKADVYSLYLYSSRIHHSGRAYNQDDLSSLLYHIITYNSTLLSRRTILIDPIDEFLCDTLRAEEIDRAQHIWERAIADNIRRSREYSATVERVDISARLAATLNYHSDDEDEDEDEIVAPREDNNARGADDRPSQNRRGGRVFFLRVSILRDSLTYIYTMYVHVIYITYGYISTVQPSIIDILLIAITSYCISAGN